MAGYTYEDDTGSSSESFGSDDRSSFKSAREAYEAPKSEPVSKPAETPRSIRRASTPYASGMAGVTLRTESTHPCTLCVDVTGSMNSYPQEIFKKVPVFANEFKKVAPGYELAVGAVGDGTCDDYPLQFQDFTSGPALDDALGMLYGEGGGGDSPESYGAAAYYLLHHCEIPNAVKPLCIFILDATCREKIFSDELYKMTGDRIDQVLSSKAVFDELQRKFTVYIVCVRGSARRYWETIVPSQQVIDLPDVGDVVEILSGIVAGEMGKFDEFMMRSKSRHADKPERIERVGKSLRSVAEKSEKSMEATGKSTTGGKSMRSKSLL